MARSIWSGAISFGLLHIPVQVMTAESPTEIPASGWKDVLIRVKQESKDDQRNKNEQ